MSENYFHAGIVGGRLQEAVMFALFAKMDAALTYQARNLSQRFDV